LVKLAVKAMLGQMLDVPALEAKAKASRGHYTVKSVVFPFLKLLGTDIALGPEMRSTGETMGIGKTFEIAYYKALLAAGIKIKPGAAFLSLRDEDKDKAKRVSDMLKGLGFSVYGTMGTVGSIEGGIAVPKIGMGSPDAIELINSGIVTLVINTPRKGGRANTDGFKIRRSSILMNIPCITNINTAFELLKAISETRKHDLEIRAFDEYI